MKKFSYAEEFNRTADVVRIGDSNDVETSYSVFVGEPNANDGEDDSGFLGEEFFSADNFTTWGDANKAKQLVVVALRQVDENLAMGLKLADVRDEVLDAIAHTKNNGEATTLEITRAINEIFDYYISHGA